MSEASADVLVQLRVVCDDRKTVDTSVFVLAPSRAHVEKLVHRPGEEGYNLMEVVTTLFAAGPQLGVKAIDLVDDKTTETFDAKRHTLLQWRFLST